MPKKKILFRVCQNARCTFKRNWIQATKCEKCGYDFILNKMPKKEKEIIITDEDLGEIKLPEVKETKKPCPDCGHICYHQAVLCENCKYNFVTQISPKKEVKTQEEREAEADEARNRRHDLGCRPIWGRIKEQPWMKYKSENLKDFANNFMLNLRKMFPEETIYRESILDYAERKLKPQLPELEKIYAVHKHGISEWRQHPTNPMLDVGEMLSQNEQLSVNRALQKFCAKAS